MEDLVREEQQEALTQKQPVEFDQAINYVNKIKDRFRFREGVYKNFLEILNQYRKAQKGIKEVYDQARIFNTVISYLCLIRYDAGKVQPGSVSAGSKHQHPYAGSLYIQRS